MPRGGLLAIATASVSLDASQVANHAGASAGEHVMLAISDTGAGMTAETMSHIFEPFFTTKPRGEGTGLGLATVYGIVNQSGGTIEVTSEPEQGTTFRVYFPVAVRRAPRPAEAPARSAPVGGGETILLAEDQAEVRALARKVLGRHGYTVLEARSGAEALRIVKDHRGPIHLLLTDVVMPEMGGRELVAALHRTHPHIPVLYASGYTDDAVARHGVVDPTLAFIHKPFTPKSLLAKVREVLDSPPSPREVREEHC
jgi:CheY-like chemotaxis protein